MARIADFIYLLTIILCVSIQPRYHGDEEKLEESKFVELHGRVELRE